MLRPNQIRDMTIEEIEQRHNDVAEDLFNLNFRRSFQQIENPLKIRMLRRELARITTILHEHRLGLRELEATSGEANGRVEDK